MSVKRFFAETARECLRRVKEEFGPDAIVVSNKPVEGGVEMVAMSEAGLEALSRAGAPRVAAGVARSDAAAAARPQAASRPAEDPLDYTVSLSAQSKKQPGVAPWSPATAREVMDQPERPRLRPLPDKAPPPSVAPRPAAAAQPAPQQRAPAVERPAQLQVAQLMGEMASIKALLERQLAGFAWGELSRHEPTRALVLSEMLDAGFSGQLSRKLIADMPPDLSPDDARKWIKGAINRRLRTLGEDNDIIERGGVFALVGPTGVGKTTTTAKLAARCVVRYGADKLALLTTDGYRIGAHEQLRIYGRILGVPVHVVRDGEDLRHTLADLRDKHMVLIDTVGMSQRDRMVAEQAAMLMQAGEVNRLLLLNATSRGDTLDDVVRAYAGEDLAGCIITKMDETASLAPAVDVAVRHGLLLTYVANGQRVPEDLYLPNRSYLLHRAFKLPNENSPHRLHNEEPGLMTAPRPGAKSGGNLSAGAALV
ncbi:flagellar biosynthesis protein FlhF [mine drainage metagenome]|uniref:Flagellar biosynthesis protein FlhF n=1 Tax=mine drainage metagenome TaxID=410659 RepID=A0A1J5S6A5_9ZZZZ